MCTNHCRGSRRSQRENAEAPGAKEEDEAPASRASRKFSRSRNELGKITAGFLYEAPWTLEALDVMRPLGALDVDMPHINSELTKAIMTRTMLRNQANGSGLDEDYKKY